MSGGEIVFVSASRGGSTPPGLLWTVAQMREAEANAGVPEGVLIDRASTAVARRALSMLGGGYGSHVLVAAGPGHNGADALWAGVKLRERGAAVDVALPLGEPRDEHGAVPLRRLLAAGARRVTEARHYHDLMVDGVLGTGARVEPRRPGREWPPWHGLHARQVLAVDMPTGVDADTGLVDQFAVRATVTVTFGAAKPGLVLAPENAGLVEVVDIGLGFPADLLSTTVVQAWQIGMFVDVPFANTDKFRRGVVGVVAGSERYPGAAALACRGAQRAGCGYVRLLAPDPVADLVRASYPEVVAGKGRADAWVVGPGLGTDDRALDLLREALATNDPVVLDADALTLVAEHRDLLLRQAPTVLTPHTGEFERLTGIERPDVEADRIGVTRQAARDLGAVVLLKGPATVVSDGARTLVSTSGPPWLGTAGTGDVLAGLLGAFLTRQIREPLQAAGAAAWLHGLAARLAAGKPEAAITALDVAEHLPDAARIALSP